MKKYTLPQIVDKITKIYSYYKVLSNIYINSKTKIEVWCDKHQTSFITTFNKLMRKREICPECRKQRPLDIKYLKLKHNNKYDYSLVKLTKGHNKINIICHLHGLFQLTYSLHLYGVGCPKCVGRNKTTEEFINECSIIHDNFYDYSETVYTKAKNNIIIICPIHGKFIQKANNHLNGQKCQGCSDFLLTKEEYINIFNEKFNYKYSYENLDFKNKQSKIQVNCFKHGIFNIKMNLHLLGIGCKQCAIDNTKLTKDEFIDRSNNKHYNKYDYSKIDFNGTKDKGLIICPNHGEFKQRIGDHLNGSGCPKCSETKGERRIRLFLEENNINYIQQYKFMDCRNKLPLPFDFYLPNYNILIEFDGRQHSEIVEFFGGEEGFKQRQINDQIKTDYCLSKNIKLIRITDDTLFQIIFNFHFMNLF